MQVVNVKGLAANSVGIKYCGRTCAGWTSSALGNPFRARNEEDRDAVIAAYRRWLWEQIKAKNTEVLAALAELEEDSVLGCWCAPRRCHCEIIIRAWKYAKENGLI